MPAGRYTHTHTHTHTHKPFIHKDNMAPAHKSKKDPGNLRNAFNNFNLHDFYACVCVCVCVCT